MNDDSRSTRGAILLGTALVVLLTAAIPARAAVAPADPFNYVVGTQTIGASYQFTQQPRLVETAGAIRDLGSSVIKFSMSGTYAKNHYAPADPAIHNLADLARSPAYRQVFEMPVADFVIWAYPFSGGPWRDGLSAAGARREYDEMHDLAAYLLTTYSGSHKRFYLGHWEGDWMLRGGTTPTDRATPAAVRGMIDWLNVRQRAVDDAKRGTPHRDVDVFHYTEVNRVRDAMAGQTTVTNDVLPNVDVDYVSYSAYDTQQHGLTEALDYIQSKLRPKSSVKGRRVFVGEYGLPAARTSPQRQDELVQHVVRESLAWGCPFVLYWEMYNNEVADGRQLGFWLIDDHAVRQPAYQTLQRFLAASRRYVTAYRNSHGGHDPSPDEFRAAALRFLPPPP